MGSTSIEWTTDVWNPTSGCDRVSDGCTNCYALTMARRLKAMGQRGYQKDGDPKTSGPGFGVSLHDWALTLPLRWKKPRKIFVNSMSDLFHKDIPDEYIAKVFAVMALTPQHTYQLLTKRHGRMRSLLSRPDFEEQIDRALLTVPEFSNPKVTRRSWPLPKAGWPLPNVWIGVSVEGQKHADLRIPALLDTPAAVRFLSCEPLLGPVDLDGPLVPGRGRPKLTYWLTGRPTPGPERTTSTGLTMHSPAIVTGPRIDWVIVGGESGRSARPMDPAWAQQIVQQCQHSHVPVFVKQLGSRWGKQHKDIDQFPAELRVRQFPETATPELS
ncbi:DUF5131 family protein [Streptomyces lydicus]|uniref:DUF5131 family protein n=1 Tax=Streptomyces lydicus TaxID=47763 RepID=UPI003797786F